MSVSHVISENEAVQTPSGSRRSRRKPVPKRYNHDDYVTIPVVSPTKTPVKDSSGVLASDRRSVPLPMRSASKRRSMKPPIRVSTGEVTLGSGKVVQDTTCKVCGLLFQNEGNLKRHMDAHRAFMSDEQQGPPTRAGVENQNQVDRSCGACSLAFASAPLLIQHKASVHGVAPPVSCTECGQSFGRRSELIAHLAKEHLDLDPNQCCLCLTQAGNVQEYVKHMANDHKIAIEK